MTHHPIFGDANKKLLCAANEFNLSLYGFDDEDGDMPIWIWHGVRSLVVYYLAVLLTLSPEGIRALGLMTILVVLDVYDDSSPRRMQALGVIEVSTLVTPLSVA